MYIENTGAMPSGLVAKVGANLRLPSDILTLDNAIITEHVMSAISYVEKLCGCTIIDKSVVELFIKIKRTVVPHFRVDNLTYIKVNDIALTVDQYKLYNNAIIKINRTVDNDVIEIAYDSGPNYHTDHINAVIMLSCAYYNNPEGIGEIDMSRLNHHMRTITI